MFDGSNAIHKQVGNIWQDGKCFQLTKCVCVLSGDAIVISLCRINPFCSQSMLAKSQKWNRHIILPPKQCELSLFVSTLL